MWTSERLIVWDWNGTLLDDVLASLDALNAILRTHRLPETTQEAYVKAFTFPVSDYYRHLGIDVNHVDWVSISEVFHLRFLISKHLQLHSDAKAALEVCRSQGCQQIILSAMAQELLEQQVAEHDLTKYFDRIIGSDNLHGISKESVAKALHLPTHAIMVGDTLHDAKVAEVVGCKVILVARGHQSAARLATAGVPVVNSLMEAVELMAHL